jgi:hypothetical protein
MPKLSIILCMEFGPLGINVAYKPLHVLYQILGKSKRIHPKIHIACAYPNFALQKNLRTFKLFLKYAKLIIFITTFHIIKVFKCN